MAHAFNDWNVVPSHSYRFIKELKEMGLPLQIYYHQGGHGGEPPFKMMNRWFTRYLLGVENGVENDPKAWIVREKDDRLSPTAYADYPHPMQLLSLSSSPAEPLQRVLLWHGERCSQRLRRPLLTTSHSPAPCWRRQNTPTTVCFT
ncbi:MAG: hypothetical protein U5L72_12160 [Bacteroidales bacterium]|nr:hypothetical protein [Bacteroidales bacterium]